MEIHSIADLSLDERRQLLRLLGFDHDGEFVTTQDGSVYLDPYVQRRVPVTNMCIMPGKNGEAIVINNNEVSICGYVADHEPD